MPKEAQTASTGRQKEAFSISYVPIYTGVTRPQVKKWIKKGWLRPSAKAGKEPG